MADAADSCAGALPRIKTPQFLQAVAQAGVPPEQRPVVNPFAGELVTAYAVDDGEHVRFINRRDMEAANLTAAALHTRALANLDRRFAQHPPVIVDDGEIYRIEAPDHLAASLLLDAAFWEMGLEKFGEPLIAVVPHRDVLAFAPIGSEPGYDALLALVAACDMTSTHALSQHLFAYDHSGWQAFARKH